MVLKSTNLGKKLLLSAILFIGLSSCRMQKGTLTDIEGHVYRTVVAGSQEWMCENLKTTSYRNGVKIPIVPDSIAWPALHEGACCWYNNDAGNAMAYGALYNWYAVKTGLLCPCGWRVPGDRDWKILEGFADSLYPPGDTEWDKQGGRGCNAGRRLKAAKGWNNSCDGGDDSCFAALPGGERCSHGRFFIAGRSGFWWSSTAFDSSYAWYRNMIYGMDEVFRNTHPKWMGFSVRCVRDK